jgi:hypothetical protein
VGNPEYQMTAPVWIRGILSDEYGVPVTSVQCRDIRVARLDALGRDSVGLSTGIRSRVARGGRHRLFRALVGRLARRLRCLMLFHFQLDFEVGFCGRQIRTDPDRLAERCDGIVQLTHGVISRRNV